MKVTNLFHKILGKSVILTRLSQHKPGLIGGLILLLILCMAIFAPYVSPYSPNHQNYDALSEPPSLKHPLGTDMYGRDIFSRIIFGTRYAFYIGIIAVLMTATIGVLIGIVGGYFGGFIDTLVTGLIDITWSLPAILAGLLISIVLGARLASVFLAIALVGWGKYARVIRGDTLSLRETPYVKSALVSGASSSRIIFKHILPNCISQIFVMASLGLGAAIRVEASLSFLGLGAQPPTPTWGAMLSEGKGYIATAPWMIMFPGIAIVIMVVCTNLLGDALRDALDPNLDF